MEWHPVPHHHPINGWVFFVLPNPTGQPIVGQQRRHGTDETGHPLIHTTRPSLDKKGWIEFKVNCFYRFDPCCTNRKILEKSSNAIFILTNIQHPRHTTLGPTSSPVKRRDTSKHNETATWFLHSSMEMGHWQYRFLEF